MLSLALLLLSAQAYDTNWAPLPAPQPAAQPAPQGQPSAPAEWVSPFPQAGAAPSAPPVPRPEARARYIEATELLRAGRHAEAVALLSELTQSAPGPEVYAARCMGLLSLQRAAQALVDCQYAASLRPGMPSALYGQAMAEEQLGAFGPAAQHFTEYANLMHPDVTPEHRAEASRRAALLRSQAPGGFAAPGTTRAPTSPSSAAPPTPPGPGYGASAPLPAPIVQPQAPAPAVRVDVSVGGRVGAPRGGATPNNAGCRSSLDCGAGGWCKDRGDGVNVCMNQGQHGDSCSSSLDCGSGGWCKDRGDGLKVCMSQGGAGASCDSNLDCAGGLWCRGDGLKTCRR